MSAIQLKGYKARLNGHKRSSPIKFYSLFEYRNWNTGYDWAIIALRDN